MNPMIKSTIEDPYEIKSCLSSSTYSHLSSTGEVNDTMISIVVLEGIRISDWVPDHARKLCVCCSRKFTPLRRRHHCRVCGEVVCKKCTKERYVHVPLAGVDHAFVCLQCLCQHHYEGDSTGNENRIRPIFKSISRRRGGSTESNTSSINKQLFPASKDMGSNESLSLESSSSSYSSITSPDERTSKVLSIRKHGTRRRVQSDGTVLSSLGSQTYKSQKSNGNSSSTSVNRTRSSSISNRNESIRTSKSTYKKFWNNPLESQEAEQQIRDRLESTIMLFQPYHRQGLDRICALVCETTRCPIASIILLHHQDKTLENLTSQSIASVVSFHGDSEIEILNNDYVKFLCHRGLILEDVFSLTSVETKLEDSTDENQSKQLVPIFTAGAPISFYSNEESLENNTKNKNIVGMLVVVDIISREDFKKQNYGGILRSLASMVADSMKTDPTILTQFDKQYHTFINEQTHKEAKNHQPTSSQSNDCFQDDQIEGKQSVSTTEPSSLTSPQSSSTPNSSLPTEFNSSVSNSSVSTKNSIQTISEQDFENLINIKDNQMKDKDRRRSIGSTNSSYHGLNPPHHKLIERSTTTGTVFPSYASYDTTNSPLTRKEMLCLELIHANRRTQDQIRESEAWYIKAMERLHERKKHGQLRHPVPS